MPTDAETEQVKVNLTNLQSFNDYLYNDGNSYIFNCYALLSECFHHVPQADRL